MVTDHPISDAVQPQQGCVVVGDVVAALATPVGGLWILTDGDPAGPVSGIGLIGGLASMVFVLATSVIMMRQRVSPTT